MDSFLRSVGASFGVQTGHHVIRDSLMGNLSENIKEIQFEFSEESSEGDFLFSKTCCFAYYSLFVLSFLDIKLELCESTNSLCTTIEAIFLHGLKDSFLRQTINVIAGEIDRRPEPNFWPPLMIFTHKQTIEQVCPNISL